MTAPEDGSDVRGHSVRVTGTVDPPSATVRIEGAEVPVRDGRFERAVRLKLGENRLTVGASAPGRDDAVIVGTITRERTRAELAAIRERQRQRRIRAKEREHERELARERERQQEIAAATKTFSGSGSKNIGSVTVNEESLLEWSNNADPQFRQMLIYDEGFGISVTSEAASGDSVVPPGTYKNITVDGGDSWTITIHPR